MSLRIAHASDLHWTVPPPLRRIAGKRLLGSANLYVRGRMHHFDRAVQAEVGRFLVRLDLDAVVLTGDLTAQALEAEFELARHDLDPVLTRLPTFVQAGNHDVYTRGAHRSDRIADTFGPWLHRRPGDPVARLDVGPVTVLGLDASRPHWTASGRVPADQLARLAGLLADPELADRQVIVALHYPVLDRRGDLYDGWAHGLRNAAALAAVLREAPHPPVAVLHGHKHHGYRVSLPRPDGAVPLFDCGASGQAFEPARDRCAHLCVYTVHAERGLVDVERFAHDGQHFVPEPGGAFATGR